MHSPAESPDPPDLRWHFKIGSVKRGPLTDAEVAALVLKGIIRRGSWAWRKGMPGWTRCSAIPELAVVIASRPGFVERCGERNLKIAAGAAAGLVAGAGITYAILTREPAEEPTMVAQAQTKPAASGAEVLQAESVGADAGDMEDAEPSGSGDTGSAAAPDESDPPEEESRMDLTEIASAPATKTPVPVVARTTMSHDRDSGGRSAPAIPPPATPAPVATPTPVPAIGPGFAATPENPAERPLRVEAVELEKFRWARGETLSAAVNIFGVKQPQTFRRIDTVFSLRDRRQEIYIPARSESFLVHPPGARHQTVITIEARHAPGLYRLRSVVLLSGAKEELMLDEIFDFEIINGPPEPARR